MKGPILPLEVDSAVEYSNRHSVPARLSPAKIVKKREFPQNIRAALGAEFRVCQAGRF